MNLTFKEFLPSDLLLLVDFLTSETWPYHSNPQPTPEEIQEAFEKGVYNNSTSCKTFWIVLDNDKRIGLIRLFDLQDSTPLFDIRILSVYRGKGIGERAINWLTNYIFTTWPDKHRIEGYTRQDNLTMRRIFQKCGYVKEACHRKAWPLPNGNYLDAVGYGILREDWKQKKITPVNWDDLGF